MKKFLILPVIFISFLCQAQSHDIIEITPAISKKIKATIESKIPGIVARIKQNDEEITNEEIEFIKDTFRIEQYEAKCIDYNWSAAGLINAASEAATKYDSLVNKYLFLLKNKLKPEDIPILEEVQRSWLSYRQKEFQFMSLLQEGKYGNSGSEAKVLLVGEYVEFIKTRTIKVFDEYMNITGDEGDGDGEGE